MLSSESTVASFIKLHKMKKREDGRLYNRPISDNKKYRIPCNELILPRRLIIMKCSIQYSFMTNLKLRAFASKLQKYIEEMCLC